MFEQVICNHVLNTHIHVRTHTLQQKSRKPDWDRIYERSKALSRTGNPIKVPLLALPFGKPPLSSMCVCVYFHMHSQLFVTLMNIHETG